MWLNKNVDCFLLLFLMLAVFTGQYCCNRYKAMVTASLGLSMKTRILVLQTLFTLVQIP